jgi:sortase A
MNPLMRMIEGLLWVCGLVMVGIFVGQLGLQEIERGSALAAYKEMHSIGSSLPADIATDPPAGDRHLADDEPMTVSMQESGGAIGTAADAPSTPDQSLWSAGRIAAFAAGLSRQTGPVLGVFEIPRFDLELPIYDGASDLHMDRGIARIEGTARPGRSDGNVGIAGHRDGYFRVLKDIQFGDEISVTTPEGTQTYIVEQLMIVDPSAVDVLDYTPVPSITLVTCYPFYHVGHAPERFIVRAVLQENT